MSRALFRTYLYAIAMNVLLSSRRRTARDAGSEAPEPSEATDHVYRHMGASRDCAA